jgi:hypothetical protein
MKILMSKAAANPPLMNIIPIVLFSNEFLNHSRKKGTSMLRAG